MARKKSSKGFIIFAGLIAFFGLTGTGAVATKAIPKIVHAIAGGKPAGTCPSVGLVSAWWIDTSAAAIGISCKVVQQQITYESNGQQETSPAGAQGVAQFMPGTWKGMGCHGSVWNVNNSMNCYIALMRQDLHTEGGNLRYALAAYNAGTGNIPAGLGYADHILAAAG